MLVCYIVTTPTLVKATICFAVTIIAIAVEKSMSFHNL